MKLIPHLLIGAVIISVLGYTQGAPNEVIALFCAIYGFGLYGLNNSRGDT